MAKLRIVYDRRYNLGFPGAQRLHPFDLRKFARSWKVLRRELGPQLADLHGQVPAAIDDERLLFVHTSDYLKSLHSSAIVATAVEVPALRRAPLWLLDRYILQPMRWATAGTVVAGRAALEGGLAFNLGGGFHHAKPNGGEGFSIYNDIAVMIAALRRENRLATDGRIACIDLDAHLGNGVAWCFRDDPTVFLFDMHNRAIYPMADVAARQRIDCPVPVAPGSMGDQYLAELQARLPAFISSISRSARISLAVYNAGTDVLAGDPLGGLALSMADVLFRDNFVLQTLRSFRIPTVVLTSGGYTDDSHRAIASTILQAVRELG